MGCVLSGNEEGTSALLMAADYSLIYPRNLPQCARRFMRAFLSAVIRF